MNMKMKFKDFAGVAAALTRMGFLTENGIPSPQFYEVAATWEAGDLYDGYREVYGETYGLEFIRDLIGELVESRNAGALRMVLAIAYDHSGTDQPELFLLLDEDERLLAFCEALVDALDGLLE